MRSQPPPPGPSPRSPWFFGKSPAGGGKKMMIIIGIALAAIAIGVVVGILAVQSGQRPPSVSDSAPAVAFIKFEMQKQEIQVGESTSLVLNIENLENRIIDDARVVVAVEPQVGTNYLSISNQTIALPSMHTNARTGDMQVTITATGAPALEAVYNIRGILTVQDTRTDIQDLQLTVRQQQ